MDGRFYFLLLSALRISLLVCQHCGFIFYLCWHCGMQLKQLRFGQERIGIFSTFLFNLLQLEIFSGYRHCPNQTWLIKCIIYFKNWIMFTLVLVSQSNLTIGKGTLKPTDLFLTDQTILYSRKKRDHVASSRDQGSCCSNAMLRLGQV